MKSVVYMTAVALAAGWMLAVAPMTAYAAEGSDAFLVSEALEVEEEGTDTGEAEGDGSQDAAGQDETQTEETSADTRESVVNYALQFLGGKYRDGGNDPHTGVDCSGFVRYVMQNGAGVSLNRSSSSQSTQGRQISSSEMQPGDLIFYGSGSRINHVAMYIGDGQIVHASTYKTGIKISNWNYRNPVKIISVLG